MSCDLCCYPLVWFKEQKMSGWYPTDWLTDRPFNWIATSSKLTVELDPLYMYQLPLPFMIFKMILNITGPPLGRHIMHWSRLTQWDYLWSWSISGPPLGRHIIHWSQDQHSGTNKSYSMVTVNGEMSSSVSLELVSGVAGWAMVGLGMLLTALISLSGGDQAQPRLTQSVIRFQSMSSIS